MHKLQLHLFDNQVDAKHLPNRSHSYINLFFNSLAEAKGLQVFCDTVNTCLYRHSNT